MCCCFAQYQLQRRHGSVGETGRKGAACGGEWRPPDQVQSSSAQLNWKDLRGRNRGATYKHCLRVGYPVVLLSLPFCKTNNHTCKLYFYQYENSPNMSRTQAPAVHVKLRCLDNFILLNRFFFLFFLTPKCFLLSLINLLCRGMDKFFVWLRCPLSNSDADLRCRKLASQ